MLQIILTLISITGSLISIYLFFKNSIYIAIKRGYHWIVNTVIVINVTGVYTFVAPPSAIDRDNFYNFLRQLGKPSYVKEFTARYKSKTLGCYLEIELIDENEINPTVEISPQINKGTLVIRQDTPIFFSYRNETIVNDLLNEFDLLYNKLKANFSDEDSKNIHYQITIMRPYHRNTVVPFNQRNHMFSKVKTSIF